MEIGATPRRPKGSGKHCVVKSCSNNSRKITNWKKTECDIHPPLLHSDCACLQPYQMHRFPGRSDEKSQAIRMQWVKNINRKDFSPKEYSTVCSIHFPDGKPTADHPYPVLNIGYTPHAFPVISVPSMEDPNANAGAHTATPSIIKPGSEQGTQQVGAPSQPPPQMGIKIEGLPQATPGVISTQGITFTVIPSPQAQQGQQRFVIPKVSPQAAQLTGINPLTIEPVGSTPGTPSGVNTVGNLTVKSVGANQAAASGANPLAANINVKPAGVNPGSPMVTIAGLPGTQSGLIAGKASMSQSPGGMATIPNLQLTTATLQQQPSATGIQQSSNGGVQQLQIPANLQAQAAQLGSQFILIKTEQGQPALGMLQKSGITSQQLQGAQIIGQAPIRLEPKVGAAVTSGAPVQGPVKIKLPGGTGDVTTLQAQQLAAQAQHQLLTKDKTHFKKNKGVKQIQIQPIQAIQPAAMVRAPLPSPTAQMQQIQAHFQSFQTPGSPQQAARGICPPAQSQSTSPAAPSVSPTAPASQVRPILQLPKVIFKQQPHSNSSKSPATPTTSATPPPQATTPTLQSFSIPTTPTSSIATTVAGSVGATFSQPIIVNQGQQRFILQTAPTNALQPGKPLPLVPVATTQLAGQKFNLVPAAKGIVPPVSLTSATVAQQLAQSRPRLTGPLSQQIRPTTSGTATATVTTTQLPTPIVSHCSPQALNISQQQLLQAGLRQPLPPGTQLHITSTSKGLQLQPIQSIPLTASTPTLVSPCMTVAQNLQLKAQAQLAPRVPTTTPITTLPQQGANLQGKITTLGQLGALSIAGNSIQVQGSLPQTSLVAAAGQMTSPTASLPLQATSIPTSMVSSQPGGQIVVQQQPVQQTQTLGAAVIGQGKTTHVGSSSNGANLAAVNAQQARVVYQQQADQGQPSGTSSSTVPANIAIQPMPSSGSPQRSIAGSVAQGTQLLSATSQSQVAQQTIVQPQLIQTCGAQATIGLIQVSISQATTQQAPSINAVSGTQAIVCAAPLQGPNASATPPNQAVSVAIQPSQISPATRPMLQVGSAGQQPIIQVVTPPLASPQMQASLSVPLDTKIVPAETCKRIPKLNDIVLEDTEPVSTIDLALKYKMSYPQAPIPRRKRTHSETEDKEKVSTDESGDQKVKEQKMTNEEKGEASKEGKEADKEEVKVKEEKNEEDDGKAKPMPTISLLEQSKTDGVKAENEVKQDIKSPVAVKVEPTANKEQAKESTSQAPPPPPPPQPRHEEENVAFTWDEYLELTGANPVPHDAFKHVEAGIKSIIKVGMKVEAPNRPSIFSPTSKTYWVATVVATGGTLLLLRFEGYGENRSADFWCELTRGDLHPIGWCARSGHILQLPDALISNNINWQEFLVMTLTGSKTIPEPYLTGKTKPTSVDRIRRGMRIELTDAEDPQYVWIAIIKENHGGRLKLRYAGIDDEKEDMWLHYLSWRVHHIGWAKAHDAVIGPPRSLRHRNPGASEAHWNTAHQYALAAAAHKDPVPKDIFKDQPKIRPHQFKVGMKLEAINPRSPSQITPATVTKVFKDKYFVVTIDDCTTEKNGGISFVCHAECGGIFPVKWCKRHGFSITPPKGYEGVKFDWNSYLRQHGVRCASSDFFRSTRNSSEHHPFQPGFKLEAVNPYHPAQISVATITKVAGRHVWLHFDGSKLPNHIVDTKGFDIFPVGWCDTNGYPLRAPKKLLAKRRKIAIVWPEKHHHNRLMLMSPGRDLYQKVRSSKPEEAAGEGLIGKLYFNHKCFSGPFLNKGRIAELPKAVGPGMVTLVIREVISLLVNAGYKPPRVLRELQVENEETAGMNGYLQIMKAKYKGKSFRALVEICKTTAEVKNYLRNMCIKLECCPNLVSEAYVEDDCPENCAMLTKTKYNYMYGKKKPPKIGRPPGPSTSPIDRKVGRRHKKRRPFVHHKKHNLLPGSSGEGGEGEAAEENGEVEPMEEGDGAGTSGVMESPPAGLAHMKHEKPAVTRARALVESAKRTKQIHHATPKLILPARERGTKMRTFAARLTSSRAQRKAEKMEEERAKKESLLTAKAEKEKKLQKHKKKSKQEVERLRLESNPLNWSVEEVVQFILKTDCASLSNIFKEQEIDGQALLLLTLPTVQECMDLKLGPAIKLCHHIERVKIAFYEQFAQ